MGATWKLDPYYKNPRFSHSPSSLTGSFCLTWLKWVTKMIVLVIYWVQHVFVEFALSLFAKILGNIDSFTCTVCSLKPVELANIEKRKKKKKGLPTCLNRIRKGNLFSPNADKHNALPVFIRSDKSDYLFIWKLTGPITKPTCTVNGLHLSGQKRTWQMTNFCSAFYLLSTTKAIIYIYSPYALFK